jgi:hypothetical protein
VTDNATRTVLDRVECAIGDAALVLGEVADAIETPEVALAYRAWLYDIATTLGYVTERIDAAIIRLHPYDRERGPMVLPGGGSVKIQGGNVPKRYDIPRLKGVLTDAIVGNLGWKGVIIEGGEIYSDVHELVEEIVSAVIDAAGADAPSFTNFRSRVFKRYGVDIKDYAIETEKTPLKVVVYGRDKEGV